MNDKYDTYMDSQFLSSFSNNAPEVVDDDYALWHRLYSIISRESNLLVDSKAAILELKDNPVVNGLIKASLLGGSDIIELEYHFDDIRKEAKSIMSNPCCNPIYCVDSLRYDIDQVCGIICCTSKSYGDRLQGQYQVPEPVIVDREPRRNGFISWKDYFGEQPPINALIITDNYVLSKGESLDGNLFELLSAILHSYDGRNKEFHLTIICSGEKQEVCPKYESIKSRLSELLDNFKFGVYLTDTSRPHDRMLLSNYFIIRSGHSFNFKDAEGKIKKDTTLSFRPLCSPNSVSIYNKEVSRLKEYIKRVRYKIGDTTNRIID